MKFQFFKRDYLFFVVFCLLIFNGCKKDIIDTGSESDKSILNKIAQTTDIPAGYIMTPAGLMKSENVHFLEPGHGIRFEKNHAFEILVSTGAKLKDFGEIPDSTKVFDIKRVFKSLGQDSDRKTSSPVPPSGGDNGSNWVTYSEYNGGLPILNLSSNWTVPVNPTNNNGQLSQLLYIWDGISPNPAATPLIQPVLQWGTNGGFGGQYWTITNWCIISNTVAAVMTPKTNVPVGTNLQGIVNYTGQQADGSFNYTCSFTGYPSQTLTIVEENAFPKSGGGTGTYPRFAGYNDAYEVLEVPHIITALNQYPNQPFIEMSNIQILTGNPGAGVYGAINWLSLTPPGATLGEHVQSFPAAQGYNGGQVYLWFQPGTIFLNAAITQNFYKNDCNTGSTGSQVPYTVPYGTYHSTLSQADANTMAQNDINSHGQTYANTHGTCTGTPVPVTVSNPNTNGGYIPSVSFLDPISNAIITSKTYYSSGGTIYVPGGTYKVVITQTNNKSLTAIITGYGSQTGQTVTFTNVVIPSSGTFMGSIAINNN